MIGKGINESRGVAIGGRITEPHVPTQTTMESLPGQPSNQNTQKDSYGKKFVGTIVLGGLLFAGIVERDAVMNRVKSWGGSSDTTSSAPGLQVDLGGAPLDKEPPAKPKNTFVSRAGHVTCTGAAVKVVIEKVDNKSPLKAFQRTVSDESGEQWRLMQGEYVEPFLKDLSNWKGHHNPQIADKMPKGTAIDLPTECKFPQIQLDPEQ